MIYQLLTSGSPAFINMHVAIILIMLFINNKKFGNVLWFNDIVDCFNFKQQFLEKAYNSNFWWLLELTPKYQGSLLIDLERSCTTLWLMWPNLVHHRAFLSKLTSGWTWLTLAWSLTQQCSMLWSEILPDLVAVGLFKGYRHVKLCNDLWYICMYSPFHNSSALQA